MLQRRTYTIGEIQAAIGLTEPSIRTILNRLGADVDTQKRDKAELVDRAWLVSLSALHPFDRIGKGARSLLQEQPPAWRERFRAFWNRKLTPADAAIIVVLIAVTVFIIVSFIAWRLGWWDVPPVPTPTPAMIRANLQILS